MESSRRFFLSVGSNIDRARNLKEAIRRLRQHGHVQRISDVWESHAVGSEGPDYLNICVEFIAPLSREELKRGIVGRIETELGRARTADKNSPRTIDIDILMEGGQPMNLDRWDYAFVVVPMADLLPEWPHPISGKPLEQEANNARASTWLRRRSEILLEAAGSGES